MQLVAILTAIINNQSIN